MLRLNLNRKPSWVDLGHGVRLKCEPMSTQVMAAARRDLQARGLSEETEHDELGIAMAKAVARRIVVEWSGVSDEDDNPLEVTPDGLDALLDVWVMFDAFQSKVLSSGFLLDQEKNGSALSPSGTSAGATSTARRAKASARTAQPKTTRRKR